MSKIIRQKMYDCPKCNTKESVLYQIIERGKYVEIVINKCNSCNKQSNSIELFKL